MEYTVRTKQGLIEGFSAGEIFKFLGVPYAEPPVGGLRWRPPVPVAKWTGSGRLKTSARYVLRLPARCFKREPRARAKTACT